MGLFNQRVHNFSEPTQCKLCLKMIRNVNGEGGKVKRKKFEISLGSET